MIEILPIKLKGKFYKADIGPALINEMETQYWAAKNEKSVDLVLGHIEMD